MIKGEAWVVLEKKVVALDPNKNETYKFFGWKQADKIDVKKEIRREVDHLRDWTWMIKTWWKQSIVE